MTTSRYEGSRYDRDSRDEAPKAPGNEWVELMNQDPPEVLPEGYLQEEEILNRPSEDIPAPMKVSSLAYKGYVRVWDTRTGVESLQPHWLMWQCLTKVREDGSQVFTRTNPNIAPLRGDDLKCVLHRESPDFAKLMQMGFKECIKGHIPNQSALNAHVSKSHKGTWAYLQQDKIDRIREEDRQLQRDTLASNQQILAAMTRNIVGEALPPAPVLEDYSGVVEVGTATITVPSRSNLFDAACPDCGKSFQGKTGKQAKQRMGLHQRQCPKK